MCRSTTSLDLDLDLDSRRLLVIVDVGYMWFDLALDLESRYSSYNNKYDVVLGTKRCSNLLAFK